MSEALREEIAMLDRQDWGAGARRPLAELTGDLRAARTEWGLAAKAADPDAYYDHYGKGYDLIVADSTVTARKALGLATTPPDHEGDGDGGGDDPGMEV